MNARPDPVSRRTVALGLVAGYLAFAATYVPINRWSVGRPAHVLYLPGEEGIPFLPEFEYLYALTYVMPLLLLAGVRQRHEYRRVATAFGIVLAVAYSTYGLFPVYLERPALAPTTFAEKLLALEYLDPSYNHFPSLHVAITWLVYLACRERFLGAGLLLALTLAISASTLFVKQHYLADVVYGAALALGAWWASGAAARRGFRGRVRVAPDPSCWGLTRELGHLVMDGVDLVPLSEVHGTPLYVASARRLRERCDELLHAFARYPGPVSAHYSYKCNPVAGVLQVIHARGLGAEVSNGWELRLALALDVPPDRIVFGGLARTDADIVAAAEAGVGLFVVDHADEIPRLEAGAATRGRALGVALRVCPDVTARHAGASFQTGSRRQQFGLDPRSGELDAALRRARLAPHLRLRGVMGHVGSGIRDFGAVEEMIRRLVAVLGRMRSAGFPADLLDVGGGLAVAHSQPFTTVEMLSYLGFGRPPAPPSPPARPFVDSYAEAVCRAVTAGCRRLGLAPPALVLEPGRSVSSDAQLLLLRVRGVKERPGLPRLVFADGGAMSLSAALLSEYHELLLVNREPAPGSRPTSVFGSTPSPMDTLRRNASLPDLEPGDLLALMDAGAYLTSTATRFAGPCPAVVLVDTDGARLVRRRESLDDLLAPELVLQADAARPRRRASSQAIRAEQAALRPETPCGAG
ncbi:MAG TPA: phosphatase PAP2 family protein [Vicinamibacteria bacterium]|nr:phosphatase PAP2 family protein [Vicinamibacteria bacterium]